MNILFLTQAVKNRWNSSARKRWLRDNGLTEAPAAAPASRSRSSSEGTGASGASFTRPPALSVNFDDQGSPSLMNSPITELLDSAPHGLGGDGLDLDPSELLNSFENDADRATADVGSRVKNKIFTIRSTWSTVNESEKKRSVPDFRRSWNREASEPNGPRLARYGARKIS